MKTYFKRHIDSYLRSWKKEANRSHCLFAALASRKVVYAYAIWAKVLNILLKLIWKTARYYSSFGENINIKSICSKLSAIYNTPIIVGETLVFIDEIQESKRVMTSLRYFYEDFPELHVIAAGSLLEFAMNELPSFGVGRIRSLYMYPFSFDEFLLAQGLSIQLDFKQSVDYNQALPDALHKQMISQIRTFYLVGGMPEAVVKWINTNDFAKCARVHNDILDTYQDDFSKYKTRISPLVLKSVLRSVVQQSGTKFTYAKVGNYNTETIKVALELLMLAGLLIPVVHTDANGLPLGAEINLKYRKFLFLDIGLMQALLGIQASDILLVDEIELVNKGGLSEVFAGLELLKYGDCFKKAEIYYWQRMQRNAQAEVDYVITRNGKIIPVEVKANVSGSMQSIYKFIETKNSEFGYRLSLENFSNYPNIRVAPLYAISNINKQDMY